MTLTLAELMTYQTIIVAFSGGKDSQACVLHLLELGVPRERIELHHHDVDGREGERLMDWPCTPAYCRAFAAALGLRLYFSWKVGGFEREMLRDGTATAPTRYEVPGGELREAGGRGPAGRRMQYPQVSADLSVRWCSAYLKIDVGACAIRGQDRFNHARTLVVSGERAEESSARAKYATFETDRTDAREGRLARHVDRWRPVHGWAERAVWEILERWSVNPHPAYRLGYGRVSCALCIFGGPAQFATAQAVLPGQWERVAAHEDRFGKTIKRKESLRVLTARGVAYRHDPRDAEAARSERFDEPAVLPPGTWRLPAGAYAGDTCGPT